MKIKDAYSSRHEPEAERVLARVYWAFLIVTFSLSIVLSIAYGTWEFFQESKRDEASVSVHPKQTFTRIELQATLKGFDNRSARFQTRMTAPVTVKDPSK